MEEPDVAVVSTTVEGEAVARGMAHRLVEERLAACVQYLPLHSVYRWRGRVESTSEYLLLIKTSRQRVAAVQASLREQHPYDVPEMLVTPVTGGWPEYLRWVVESTADGRVAED